MQEKLCIRLYRALSSERYIPARTLSELLHVSTSSVRIGIRELDERLRPFGAVIERKSGCGFRVKIVAEKAFADFYEDALSDCSGALPQTSRERAEYILDYLLHAQSYVKMEALVSILFLSAKTLSGDLKVVEQELKKWELSIQRKPYYGLLVVGSEFQIRKCLIERTLVKGNGVLSDQVHQNEEMRGIFVCLNKCFQIHGYETSDMAFQDLVVCVSVTMQRLKGGHFIARDPNWDYYIYANQVFRISQEIVSQLEQYFCISFPSSEVDYLALQLAGYRRMEPSSIQDSILGENTKAVADLICAKIKETLGFDFSGDMHFKKSFIGYLIPMEIRLRFGLRQHSPFVESVKGQFPLAFELASIAVHEIGAYYHCQVERAEISDLAMAFELALERYRFNLPRKSILLVCSSGNLAAEWLKYKYKDELRLYIDQVYTCDTRSIGGFDFSKVDYVFSSEPLPEIIQKPCAQIRYIFDDRDFYDNCRFMRRLLDEDGRRSCDGSFVQELFFPNESFSSPQEAVAFLGEKTDQYLGGNFQVKEMVLARARISSPCILHQIAVLQMMRSCAEQTFIAVATLSQPVLWYEKQVRAFFLIHNGRADNARLHEFYQILYRALKSEQITRHLLQAETFSSFCQAFLASLSEGDIGRHGGE